MHLPRQVSLATTHVPPATAVGTTQTLHCLIVATDEARRENFGFAAREGGWDVTLCCEPEAAIALARQRLLQMAIIDLSGAAADESVNAAHSPALRFLIEQLACTSRMLLLVCGNLDDPCEEVWARHLGVWMYLPGAIDGAELVGLCVAARETIDRLAVVARSRATRGGERKTFRLS